MPETKEAPEPVADVADVGEQKSAKEGKKEGKEGKYAVLQEVSGAEWETWLYFIRYDGNEEALRHLQEQLKQVDWIIVDDMSTFDLELDFLVSAQTAKEMTKIDLNHHQFHRKFDGQLQKIDFGFKSKDKNKKKIWRVNEKIGDGRIDEFVDGEDIDPEDMRPDNEEESESFSSSQSEESSSESESESEEESKHSSHSHDKKGKKKGPLPAAAKIEPPRFAKAKMKRRK